MASSRAILATLPVSLDEVKAAARIDHDDEDALLRSYLEAALETLETAARIGIRDATVTLELERFPGAEILLPYSPARSVTSVRYWQDDVFQAALLEGTDYRVDLLSNPSRILRVAGVAWPRVDRRHDAVSIEYVSGYTAATLPPAVRAAALELATHYYETREPIEFGRGGRVVPYALEDLVATFARPEVY